MGEEGKKVSFTQGAASCGIHFGTMAVLVLQAGLGFQSHIQFSNVLQFSFSMYQMKLILCALWKISEKTKIALNGSINMA